jgi:iron-sulfur cluster assembly accessory protein
LPRALDFIHLGPWPPAGRLIHQRAARENARAAENAMELSLPVTVTDRAFARLAEIAEAGGAPKALRVAVLGGGCSGFQYEIGLEDAPAGDDLVIEKDGMQVLIDPQSRPFLEGSTIDFTDELIGARFSVQNPNAASTCGCGTSFSI